MKKIFNQFKNFIQKHLTLTLVLMVIILSFVLSPAGKKIENNYSSYLKKNPASGNPSIPSNSGVSNQPEKVPNLTPEEYKQLYEGEAQYNAAITNLIEKYPWYRKIPIDRPDYFIVFDFNTNSFRIRFKTPNASLDQALQNIKNIGAVGYGYYIIKQ